MMDRYMIHYDIKKRVLNIDGMIGERDSSSHIDTVYNRLITSVNLCKAGTEEITTRYRTTRYRCERCTIYVY